MLIAQAFSFILNKGVYAKKNKCINSKFTPHFHLKASMKMCCFRTADTAYSPWQHPVLASTWKHNFLQSQLSSAKQTRHPIKAGY
jgi:hypothetical protein